MLTGACKTHQPNVLAVGGLRYGLSLGPLKPSSQYRISPKKQYCPFTVSPHELCLIKMLFFFLPFFEHLVLISPWRRVILLLSPTVGQLQEVFPPFALVHFSQHLLLMFSLCSVYTMTGINTPDEVEFFEKNKTKR